MRKIFGKGIIWNGQNRNIGVTFGNGMWMNECLKPGGWRMFSYEREFPQVVEIS
jgi:hypothetical protein